MASQNEQEIMKDIKLSDILGRFLEPIILYYPDGKVKSIMYLDINNKLHRDDGPALTKYSKDGCDIKEYWYNHGNLSDTTKPSYIHRMDYGTKIESKTEIWYYNNKIHRDGDEPAHTLISEYSPSDKGSSYKKYWYTNGKNFRLNGPACIIYCVYYKTTEEYYYDENEKLHREDGPAYIYYGGDMGTKIYKIHGEFVQNGKPNKIDYNCKKGHEECYYNKNIRLHREDGPAVIKYYPSKEIDIDNDKISNNKIRTESWYINGVLTKQINYPP